MSSQHTEIKSALVKVYEKLSKAITKDIGYDQYKIIIQTYIQSDKQINYILQQVSDYIGGLSVKDKETGLKLLPLVFCTTLRPSDCYRVLSPILSIIQFNITESNISIIPIISNCFGKIVQCSMQNDIELEEIDENELKIYEILQGFCIYNMKQNEKANKICGSSCLTRLVENCPFVLQPEYMRFIWENIMHFIDKKNFTAKYELLNCLISIILGAEASFTQFANVTLYKVMDFLTDNDWIKRKLALNVVYTLILYCKDEVMPLKEQIVEFLKGLKSDKVKEVREVCLLILHKLSETEGYTSTSTKEEGGKQKTKMHQRSKSKGNYANYDRDKDKERDKSEDNQSIKVNMSINNISNSNNNNLNEQKNKRQQRITLNKALCNSSSNFDIINAKELNSSGDKKPLTPTRPSQRKKITQMNLNKSQEEDGIERKGKEIVNRKDNSFVNEKMVIRRNPNYSIYKSGPNQDFFKQANNQQDIIVLENKNHHNKVYQEEEIKNKDKDGDNNEEIIINSNEATEIYVSKKQSKAIEGIEINITDNDNSNDNNDKDRDNEIMKEKSIENDKTKFRNKGKNRKIFQNSYDKEDEQISFKSNVIKTIGLNTNPNPTSNIKSQLNQLEINKEKDNVNSNTNAYKDTKGDLNDKSNEESDTIRNTYPNSNYQMQLKKPESTQDTISNKITTKRVVDNYIIGNNASLSSSGSSKSNGDKPFQYYSKNAYCSKEQEQHINNNNNDYNSTSNSKNNNNMPSTNPVQPNNTSQSKLLTELLEQMKNLSQKQVFLIDTLAEMQEETAKKIDTMTSKMSQLEMNISLLSNTVSTLKTTSRPQTNSIEYLTNRTSSSYNYSNKKRENWEDIQSNLNCFNIDQAFAIALSNDADLFKLITEISSSQLREASPSLINDSVLRLITLLPKGNNISIILSYFKNILMRVKCELRRITIQNIQDILLYLSNNHRNFTQMTDENIVDINLILSYLNTIDK